MTLFPERERAAIKGVLYGLLYGFLGVVALRVTVGF